MARIENLNQIDAERILQLMNDLEIQATSSTMTTFEIAKSAIQVKSISHLTKSIDEFRKSNEKTSNRLVWLTGVIGVSTLVQAIYVATLLFKK